MQRRAKDVRTSAPPRRSGLLALRAAHAVIGVAPEHPVDAALVDSFWAHASATYGPLDGSTWTPRQDLFVPAAWLEAAERFSSPADLKHAAMTRSGGANSSAAVYAGILLSRSVAGGIDYTIRMTDGASPSTAKAISSGFDTAAALYAGGPGGAAGGAPPFAALQLLVDRWAIGSTPASVSDGLDVGALSSLAGAALLSVGDGGAAAAQWAAAWAASVAAAPGGSAAAASLVGPLEAWLAGERLAPQSVRILPFPSPPTASSGQFYTYGGKVVCECRNQRGE